jgi:hypothetical protein
MSKEKRRNPVAKNMNRINRPKRIPARKTAELMKKYRISELGELLQDWKF